MSAPNTVLFCSGCDHAYFPMLKEWMESVKAGYGFNPEIHKFAILDTGLNDEDREWLKDKVAHIHQPDWPCKIAGYKIRGREYLKSCVCRPWLSTYFPGYETYFWMDPDAWVQDWVAVDYFLQGAARGKLTVTAQADRAYPRSTRIKWLGPLPYKLRGFYFSNAKNAFGLKKAKELYPYHVLLSGAFALRGDAPHWKRWQELVIAALQKGKVFTAEQMTMGILCHLEKYPVEILPGWMHWLASYKPLWDNEKQHFVEPYLPHMPIGLMHVSGFDDMRRNPEILTELETTEGKKFSGSLRYNLNKGRAI